MNLRKCFLYGLLLIPALLAAQPATKLNFDLQRQLATARTQDYEVAVFVRGDLYAIRTVVEQNGGVYKYAAGEIASVRLPISKIPVLAQHGSITRIESNDLKLQSLNDQMVVNNKVQPIHYGFNLPQGYEGQNVVLGIIDEGIDYTHPDFRNEFGQTRIKYLWDHSIINFDPNTQPQPYGYGKQYIGNQIDTATQHFDSPFSHGSHVAGIACGSGQALNNYKGVAPKSDMIVVKMNLNQPDNQFLSSLVDAVKYTFDRAADLGKPCVINVSLGTYFGSHDAKDIQAQAIENLIASRNGQVLVCAAGNAGTAPIHLGYTIQADTTFTWFQYSSQGIYLQAWGDSGNFENAQLSVGIDRVKPTRSYRGGLPFRTVLTQPGILKIDTIYNGSNRLGIVQSLSQFINGSWTMEYYIVPDSVVNINGSDTSRYMWRFMTKGSGKVDVWSFDMVFDNLPDSISYPFITKYKKPDNNQTIVSSFSCSDRVITVGSYVNRNYYTNANFAITRDTNIVVGSLSAFSSRGPTRDGRIKPDLTATGEWILSCGTQSELNILAAVEPEKVAAGRKHKRSSGTSMASPVVAGIAALYLQKNPSANWFDVKQALINCTDKDSYTGVDLPNAFWGYGKVNGYSALKGCTVGIDELYDYSTADFGHFPNPNNGHSTVYYDLSSLPAYKSAHVVLYDSFGRQILNEQVPFTAGTLELSLDVWPAGIYMCALQIDGKQIRTTRMMIIK